MAAKTKSFDHMYYFFDIGRGCVRFHYNQHKRINPYDRKTLTLVFATLFCKLRQ